MIDFFVIGTAVALFDALLHEALSRAMWPFLVALLAGLALAAYSGATPGQRLFKLRTVDRKTLARPTLLRLVLREIIALSAVTGIGFLAMLVFGFYWDRATGIAIVKQ